MIKQMSLYDALIEYPECEKLVLYYSDEGSSSSGMGEIIWTIKEDPSNSTIRFAKHIKVWLYFKAKKLRAWAWLFQKPNQKIRKLSFFIYCLPEIRKKGVGQKLYYLAKEEAQRRHRKMVVHPWNLRSRNFYDKLKAKNQESWF